MLQVKPKQQEQKTNCTDYKKNTSWDRAQRVQQNPKHEKELARGSQSGFSLFARRCAHRLGLAQYLA
jgi:hypothetical protein